MARDSFIFYRSFYEAIQDLPDNEKLKLFNAICEMSLNERKIELTGMTKTLFKVIEPQLQANNERYSNGRKGGRPKKETIDFEKEKTIDFEKEKPMVFENKNHRF